MKKLTLFGSMLLLAMQLTACAEGGGRVGDGCPPKDPCGNGVVDKGEACDPGNGALNLDMNLNGESCQNLANTAGQLKCNCGCQYDMSMCMNNKAVGGTGG